MSKICKEIDCYNPSPFKDGYCRKHHAQILRKGLTYRSWYDPNLIILQDGYFDVILASRSGKIVGYTSIDIEDIEKVIQYRWHCVFSVTTAYARSEVAGHLSHLILGKPPNRLFIDHKNGNGLDNRKSNLRFCTTAQNIHNSRKPSNNITGYKGVCLDKGCKCKKWIARLYNDRKHIYIGHFYSPIEAAKAYDKKAKELFGDFARPNFP